MDWWGRSEETIPEEVPEDLVQRAFTEHGDGAVQRPNVPTQEFQNGLQLHDQQDGGGHLDYEDEEEDEYDYDEPEIEFSNLVDNHGNRLPMFSNEFWAFKQDEYLYLHHELPGEQMSEAAVLPRESIFFRAPRETPGWRPGGRFLYHASGQSSVEDMQEREQYAARKARAKAREVAAKQKQVLLEREKKLTRGAEPKRFLRLAESARYVRQQQDDRHADASDRDRQGAQAPSRQQLQEESRVQLEADVEDWRLGRGKRVVGANEMAAERLRVLRAMRAEKPENPLLMPEMRTDGVTY